MGKSGIFGLLIERTKNEVNKIAPFPEKERNLLTIKEMLFSTLAGGGTAYVVFRLNSPVRYGELFFSLLAMAFAGILMTQCVSAGIERKRMIRLYNELPDFFACVRRKYMLMGNMSEAIVSGANGRSREIVLNALELKGVLLSGKREEVVRNYVRNPAKDRFFKLFLMQAFEASEYGDTILENGGSAFGENVQLIRSEVVKCVCEIRKRQFATTGYVLVSVMPFLLFTVIRQMGQGLSSGLAEFYEREGQAVLLIGFLVTLFTKTLIRGNGELRSNETNLETLFRNLPAKVRKKGEAIEKKINQSKKPGISFLHGLLRKAGSTASASDLLLQGIGWFIMAFVMGSLGMDNIGGQARVTILLMVAFVAACFPFLSLILSMGIQKEKIREEVKNLHIIILVERNLRSINITGLLEDLELFAVNFRNEIRECIIRCQMGEQGALQRFKEETCGKSADFQGIAEGFLAVDDVGIREAFGDLKGNLECLEQVGEIDNEIQSVKRKNILDIVTWIPGMVMLGGYFIVPFVLLSLSEMERLFGLM